MDIIESGNEQMNNFIVITSINEIADATKQFLKYSDWKVLVVGDLKSKPVQSSENFTFLSTDAQKNLQFKSLESTPYNHYCRKNIGYLYAIRSGCEYIYETDDDTFPMNNWSLKDFNTNYAVSSDKFFNIYSLFTNEFIWPRGLHLPHIRSNEHTITSGSYDIGVWQGIINGDSDVDAIYRLTIDKHVTFEENKQFSISKHTYVPFNTQSTLWNKKFFKLMYLPISVNFRYTDILRSYIAQRILWEHESYVGFHSPNTYQIRNAHNYYIDFLNEVQMYETVPIVVDCLESISLTSDIDSAILLVYENLLKLGVVADYELHNLNNWIDDINKLPQRGSS